MLCEHGASQAMSGIVTVVDAASVVKYGEEFDDFDARVDGRRDTKPVFENTSPMVDAVDAAPFKLILRADGADEGKRNHVGLYLP